MRASLPPLAVTTSLGRRCPADCAWRSIRALLPLLAHAHECASLRCFGSAFGPDAIRTPPLPITLVDAEMRALLPALLAHPHECAWLR